MIGTRIDYCNAILYWTTKANVHKLQRVQNSIARIVTGTKITEDITPVFAQLHWLIIAEAIKRKVALLPFKARTTHQPAYHLCHQLQLCTQNRQIRSSTKISRLQLNSSKTVFVLSGNADPLVWLALQHHLTDDRSSLTSVACKMN